MSNIVAVPAASQADLLIFHCSIDKQNAQMEEWLLRPRGLPALPRVANDSAERLARESLLAQSLQLHGSKDNCQGVLPQQDSALSSPMQMLALTEKRTKWGLESYGSAEVLGLSCIGKQALGNPEALMAVRELNPDHMMMALKRTFERYNLWEHGTNKVGTLLVLVLDISHIVPCKRHGLFNGLLLTCTWTTVNITWITTCFC
jgi:hypothetical protein